MAVGGQLIP